MIYIIFGTIAEYIKLFPIMKQFDRHGIKYMLVDTGQQVETVQHNIIRLGKRKPEYTLTSRKKNIENIPQMIVWMCEILFNARNLHIKKKDFVIVHGSAAMPTFLGFIIGRFYGAKIAHVESGKRTYHIFNPFPEELISMIVSHFSDICFPADHIDTKNLAYRSNVYETNGNTVIDAVKEILKYKPSVRVRKYCSFPYVLFLVRRHENILVKKNLDSIVNILQVILKGKHRVLWPVHTRTQYVLKKKDFWNQIIKLSNLYSLTISDLYDYVDFIYLLSHCEFVVTDASGIQEEAYFLNKPTLILRGHSPNPGIGETAILSHLKTEKVYEFLKKYKKLKRKRFITGSPSKVILEVFRKQLL